MSAAAEAAVAAAPAAGRAPARAWIVFTTVLMWAVFLQAVTAGRIFSGDEWARDVHRTAAGLVFLVAVAGGIVAIIRLRGRTGGRRFGLMLVAIGIGLFAQHRLGSAAADGEDTLWLHVPLGVALVGILAHTSQRARRVGGPGVIRRRAVGALAAVAVTALLLTGCGDDGADEGGALRAEGGGADLTIEAHDIEFDRDAYRIAAGPVDIAYTHEGALPHSLVIEAADGRDIDGFKLEVGDTDADSGTVDLMPGGYVLYCDVAGHREAGMEAELRVE